MISFGIGFDSTFAIWRRKGRRKWPPSIIKLFFGLVLFLMPAFLNAMNLAVLRADPQLASIEATTKGIIGGMEDRTEEEEEGFDDEEEEEDYVKIVGQFEENTLKDQFETKNLHHFGNIFDTGAPSTQAQISVESWERYQLFKEETCRKRAEEEYLAEKPLNSTQSEYFHWEANEFHRQLRDRLLPQTRGGTFSSLIGSSLLSRLDPRLFASKPRSLCKAKRHISEADERQKLAKEEQHMFEDFLINKVLPVEMFAPRRSPSNSNSNAVNNTRKAEL